MQKTAKIGVKNDWSVRCIYFLYFIQKKEMQVLIVPISLESQPLYTANGHVREN